MKAIRLPDVFAVKVWGITPKEAKEKGICIACKSPVSDGNLRNEDEAQEYAITALCGPCFDAIVAPE